MLIDDFKWKHIEKFVSAELGTSICLLSMRIDPQIYFFADEDDNRLEGSDYQSVMVTYKEKGGSLEEKEEECLSFRWDIDSEEIFI